ncbi:hypothetical protein LOD99_16118 [Oopsacas minuta]|uniref:BEN domain-containing protein n=1 Tax=Oopsacas minuta TaxID=111878 RepID=A0AAV7K800_9METZ|nr:hypothetical protein LOD99_16118 [Oopsacas minuta]
MDQIIVVEAETETCPKCDLKESELQEVKLKLSALERDNIILRQKLICIESNLNIATFYNQTAAQLTIDPHTNIPVVSIIEPLPLRTSPEIFIPTQVYINPANQTSTEDLTMEPSAPDSTANSVALDSDYSGDIDPQPVTICEEHTVTSYTNSYPDTIYDFSNDICSYISANITRGVSSSTIQKCLATAHNEAHFAARLAQKMFTKEELSTSNITGRTSIPGRAINKLDSHRLELIKQAVCYAYKIECNSEKIKMIWKKCKMSINEVCRRPRRSRVQLSNSPFKYVTTKGLVKTPKKEPMTMSYLSPQANLAQVLSYQTDAQIVPSGTEYVFIQNADLSSYSPINLPIKEESHSTDQSPEPTN